VYGKVRILPVCVAIVLSLVVVTVLVRTFRPSSGNHILLINGDGSNYTAPLTIEFTGDSGTSWTKTLTQHPCGGIDAIAIADVSEAFFDGVVSVRDGDGSEVCSCQFVPRGRINQTAVIVCSPDSKAIVDFGYLPSRVQSELMDGNPGLR
jgi:hypothetical protein